jgi:hypothetical protein
MTTNVPVHTADNQWTQFASFPQFLEGVGRIDQISPAKTHRATKIAGVTRGGDEGGWRDGVDAAPQTGGVQ